MAQIVSLLAVATVFIGLWTLILYFTVGGGGGGLMCEGGIFAGFYGTWIHNERVRYCLPFMKT